MSTRHGFLVAVALSAACVGPSAARASCGAEGCPLEIRGPESGGGRFGLEMGYQFVDQDKLWDGSGTAGAPDPLAHEVEVETRTQTWLLTGRGSFGRRLLVSSTLPYIDRMHNHLVQHHPGLFVPAEWHYRGLGDLLTSAQYNVIGGGGHGTSLDLRAGIKLPTGRRNVPEVDGAQPEPPARPGTGSTDFIAGFQLRRPIDTRTLKGAPVAIPVSLGVVVRANGRGTEGYRMGNEAQATLAGGYALSGPLRLLMQVNWRYHAGDDPGASGEGDHTPAGTSLYLTPGIRAQVTSGIAAFGYWQVRAFEHTDGPQLVAPHHLLFGLSYSFAS